MLRIVINKLLTIRYDVKSSENYHYETGDILIWKFDFRTTSFRHKNYYFHLQSLGWNFMFAGVAAKTSPPTSIQLLLVRQPKNLSSLASLWNSNFKQFLWAKKVPPVSFFLQSILLRCHLFNCLTATSLCSLTSKCFCKNVFLSIFWEICILLRRFNHCYL